MDERNEARTAAGSGIPEGVAEPASYRRAGGPDARRARRTGPGRSAAF
ncbi:hypothetical protein [Streptomyces sp. NPDC019208]